MRKIFGAFMWKSMSYFISKTYTKLINIHTHKSKDLHIISAHTNTYLVADISIYLHILLCKGIQSHIGITFKIYKDEFIERNQNYTKPNSETATSESEHIPWF